MEAAVAEDAAPASAWEAAVAEDAATDGEDANVIVKDDACHLSLQD